MKFKIDENLPQEYAELLQRIGFLPDTVGDERLRSAGGTNEKPQMNPRNETDDSSAGGTNAKASDESWQ